MFRPLDGASVARLVARRWRLKGGGEEGGGEEGGGEERGGVRDEGRVRTEERGVKRGGRGEDRGVRG